MCSFDSYCAVKNATDESPLVINVNDDELGIWSWFATAAGLRLFFSVSTRGRPDGRHAPSLSPWRTHTYAEFLCVSSTGNKSRDSSKPRPYSMSPFPLFLTRARYTPMNARYHPLNCRSITNWPCRFQPSRAEKYNGYTIEWRAAVAAAAARRIPDWIFDLIPHWATTSRIIEGEPRLFNRHTRTLYDVATTVPTRGSHRVSRLANHRKLSEREKAESWKREQEIVSSFPIHHGARLIKGATLRPRRPITIGQYTVHPAELR